MECGAGESFATKLLQKDIRVRSILTMIRKQIPHAKIVRCLYDSKARAVVRYSASIRRSQGISRKLRTRILTY